MVRRIAILGPESTGKSNLASHLASHYNTNYVPECARDFFDEREYSYNFDDLEVIAKGQFENENEAALLSNNLLFCDTEFISIAVWSQVVFNKVSEWISAMITDHVYDLYLLCNLDVEWEYDPLRKNDYNRQYIYDMFVRLLDDYELNYRIVTGVDDRRNNNAVRFIDDFLNYEKE